MESADIIRLQECVERNKNKQRRTDGETKQDNKAVRRVPVLGVAKKGRKLKI